jgi:hypothetical protein
MARIAPDANDLFVIKFDDTGTTHVNSGTLGAAGNFLEYGNPISGAQGLLGNALYIPSSFISPNHDGAGGANDVLVTPNISMSGWVYVRRQPNFFAEVWNKQYFLNGWSTPFLSFGIQMDNGSNGGWTFYITTAGTLRSISMTDSVNQGHNVMPQGRWCHVGGTWDGTTLLVYLNGSQVNSLVPGGGAIDYGTAGNRGQWYSGAIPGSSTIQGGPVIVQDLRIANVVRPQSYFANIYFNGMFVNG